MKKLMFYITVLLLVVAGCRRADYLLYSDASRLQMADTSTQNSTFVYDPPAVTRDTFYIQINTMGEIKNYDRPVQLKQISEFTYTYVRDPITNQILDTIATEVPFKAVPGVHYLDINDKTIRHLLVIKANQETAKIPVVLLRDSSLKTNSYRLRLQLLANTEFSLGAPNAREKTIVFSDKLERFPSWSNDNGSPAFYIFGKYSTVKHQFMIDVLKVRIDEEWYQAVDAMGAWGHYQSVMNDALDKFNADPANIASGKSPLRESDSPSSLLVTF